MRNVADQTGIEALRAALEPVAEYGQPGPGSAELLDVGTARYLDYFDKEVLSGHVEKGCATCRFYEGPYGAGKTHLLGLLREVALRRGMAVVSTELSADLPLENWKEVTAFILQNISARVDTSLVHSLPRILDALAGRDGVSTVGLLNARLPHPGFRKAMKTALEVPREEFDPRSDLSRYLMGERIGVGMLRKKGVLGVRDPLSKRNAEQVLTTVLAGLARIGVRGTMLLFDENEQMLARSSRSSSKTQLAANLIRRLIDGCASGTIVHAVAAFAVLPGFLQNCADIYPALGQRLRVEPSVNGKVAWRWPVLPVDGTSEAFENPELFLDEIVSKLVRLLDDCGCEVNGLRQELSRQGMEIVQQHASSGYRRHLMKSLATRALGRL